VKVKATIVNGFWAKRLTSLIIVHYGLPVTTEAVHSVTTFCWEWKTLL